MQLAIALNSWKHARQFFFTIKIIRDKFAKLAIVYPSRIENHRLCMNLGVHSLDMHSTTYTNLQMIMRCTYSIYVYQL